MGEAVVCFLVERLSDLLNEEEEAEVLHGVREPVEEIIAALRLLQGLLKDTGARRNEECIRTWAADVRNLVYDATDILESIVIRIASERRVGKKTLKSVMNERLILHKMRREIKAIKRRISQLRAVFQTFGITSSSDSSGITANTRRLIPLDRTNYSAYHVVADQEVIGLETDIKDLVGHLVNDQNNGGDQNCYRFISIFGMGGLGKTTLARKIYNHPTIMRHFDCLLWVCISQQWQTNDVLQRILLNLIAPDKRDEVLTLRDKDELAKLISDTLRGKRYLVVLDDIWSIDVWDCLKAAFPFENTSSKILLTTRKTEVAQRVGLESNLLHEPKLLNDEQSWGLLKKKTCITRYRHTDPRDAMELEKLGREMIRRCRGLPLAILVLGGILATKPTLTEWEKVHKEFERGEGSLGKDYQEEVKEVLISSYYDLPDQLKPCFMYLSKFPEDSEIGAERLYQLWMAEGMVLSKDRRDGDTMMDVAESYMGELSQRCMVQVQVEEEESSVRMFKSCRLHDLMRDLSFNKAKEEDFFRVIGNNNNPDQSRRLAFYPSYKYDEEKVHIIHDKELVGGHLRSLFLTNSSGWVDPSPDLQVLAKFHSRKLAYLLLSYFFRWVLDSSPEIRVVAEFHPKKLEYLRVFALEGGIQLEFKGKHIMRRNIIHLRYLSLSCSHKSVFLLFTGGILEHLQTLDLRQLSFVLTELSSMLRNMGRRLQHLYLPYKIERDTDEKLRLDGVSNLEMLENFDPDWCETKDLFKLTNLRKLTVTMLYDFNVEVLEEILNYLQSSQASNNLRYSSLAICPDTFIGRREKGKPLLRQLWAPNCNIHSLSIMGPYKLQLPTDVSFSSNLTTLYFSDTNFEVDPMPTLERIPNLRRLYLWYNAYMGKEMVCSAMGFPQLRRLFIFKLVNLEEWRVHDGAMCNLSELHIGGCKRLKTVPDGFRFLRALRELNIRGLMSDSFQDGIRSGSVPGEQVGQDFYKIRHVPRIIHTPYHQATSSEEYETYSEDPMLVTLVQRCGVF